LAICSGILEYVNDAEAFFRFVTANSRGVILSYNVLLPGDSKVERLAKDWISHFSIEEIGMLTVRHGLRVAKKIQSNPLIPQRSNIRAGACYTLKSSSEKTAQEKATL
jgi:hypothetical protein